MLDKRRTPIGLSLKSLLIFTRSILCFVIVVAVLGNVGTARAAQEKKNDRWVSFSQMSQRSAAMAARRIGEVKVTAPSAEEVNAETMLAGMYLKDKTMRDGKTYSSVIAPGGGTMEAGKPDLPAFGNWILIPNGTKVVLQVNPGKPIVYSDIDIPPVQPPLAEVKGAKRPPFTKDAQTYAADTPWPGVFAEIKLRQSMRGQECGLLWVYPFQFNPGRKILKVYPDLTVTVRFAGKPRAIPSRLKSKSFEKTMRRLAVNGDVVLAAEQDQAGEENGIVREVVGDLTGCDYLIICPPDFETAADTLAAWKNKSGFRTEVVTTDDTGSGRGEIKTYLIDAYDTWDPVPQYVLFFGDSEDIPTYETYFHPDRDHATYPQGNTGTDFIYATMGTTDTSPEYITGRVPVDTATQATNWVNSLIDYEKNPPTTASFYTNVTCAAAYQDGEDATDPPDGFADRRFAKTSEDIRNWMNGLGYSVTRIYVTENRCNNTAVDPNNWSKLIFFTETEGGGDLIPDELRDPPFKWDGSGAKITTAVNAGTFFLTHRDHGSRSKWGAPEFKKANVDALTNGTWRPVVWSINCMTGWFDNECDQPICDTGADSESFTESWLRNSDGGAVGVMASTRISWSGINDRLVWGWMDAIWPNFIDSKLNPGQSYPSAIRGGNNDPIYRMGDVLQYGRTYMLTQYACNIAHSDRTWSAVQEFHWFGDPTMEMWTAQPKTLSVSKPGFSSQHKYVDVTVKDTSSNPLAGARVTLYNADNGWYSGTTGADGKIRLSFSGAVTASFDLTVTLHNYKPHTETISIAYTDTTFPSAPIPNSQESLYLKSAPASVDIDFLDNSNLDEVCYKIDSNGQWYSIQSGIAGASYNTNWPLSTTAWNGLSQGSHYLYFSVVDDGGNETLTANNTAAFEIIKDTVAPTEVSNLTSTSHTEGAYSNDNTIAVSWTAATDATSGVHGYSYLWSHASGDDADTTEDIGSGITSLTSGALADGKWYLNISACDSIVDFDGTANPHWGSDAHTGPFYIDMVDPQAPTYRSNENQWFSSEPRLNIDFQDDKQLDTASWREKGDVTWTPIFSNYNGAIYNTDWDMDSTAWDGLAEGTNFIHFMIIDDAGNSDTTSGDVAAFTLVKDVTFPTVDYNLTEGEYHGSSAPTLNIDFTDMMGSFNGKLKLIRYRFNDSGNWITIAPNVGAATYNTNWQVSSSRWSELSDGTHYIYFYISDKAGNITQTQNDTQAFEIRKDTLPPVASAVVTNIGIIIEGDTVNFDGTGSTDASGIDKYEWDFDSSNPIQIDATGSTASHIYGIWGNYTATLAVYDPAGNKANTTVKVDVRSRPVASIDSIIPAPAIAGQKVSFVGSGTDADWDTIVGYNWRSDRDGDLSTSRIFNTNTLSPSDSTPHTIYFKVKDIAGLWSDEVYITLWVYLPKEWDMFKENDPRLSAQSTYPNAVHGQWNFAVGWNFLADSAITGSPVAANLDGKFTNGLEIAFASSAGTLYTLNSAGKFNWSVNIGASSSSTPAIEDINGDGKLDIVVGSSNGVYAYDFNKNNIYTFSTDPNSVFDSSPVITEIDANSTGRETIIGSMDGNVYAIGSGGGQLWAFPSPSSMAFTSSPAIANLDPNGPPGPETVICGTDGILYVLNPAGTQITSYTTPAPTLPINTTPAVADLVPTELGWPGPEIVFGSTDGRLYCLNYNNSTLTLIWTYPAAGNPPLAAINSSPAVGKVGENGDTHVAFGCQNGNAYVIRTDVLPPQVIWFSCGGAPQINSTPAIANIDTVNFIGGSQGDLPEVIFGATDGKLYAVSYAAGVQNLPWSPLTLSAGQALDSSPAIVDLNHSPDLEILIGSANSRLYMVRATSGINLGPIAIIKPFNPGIVGTNLVLDASESEDPDESTGDYIAKYEWDINPPGYDLYETTEAVATLTWAELEERGIHGPGDYPVAITVYDSFDEPSPPEMATIAIREFITPPVADVNDFYDIFVGSSVTLNGSASYAVEPGNYIVDYSWDLDDDGGFDDESGEQVTLSWQDLDALGISTPGSQYTIWLKVTDWLGQESTPAESTLTILENQLPIVSVVNSSYEIEQGNPVTLEATGSDPDDPEDWIVLYEWDIDGDGVYGEYSGISATVPWAFLETACPGRGEDNPNPVRVRACDTRGGYGTSPPANLYIYINDLVAVARANDSYGPIGATVFQEVTFDHSESYHQWASQHSIVLYEWDFEGDAVYDWSTIFPGDQPTHFYTAPGTYNAKLRITDDNGPPKTAIDTVEITVANFPPIADADGPHSAPCRDSVTLDGSGSYDTDGSIVNYEWDLNNDGTFGDRAGVSPLLTWADLEYFGLTEPGTVYPISLRITDDLSATGIDSTTLTITKENVAIEDPTSSASSLVYSDAAIVTVSVIDNDGENLIDQLALPKTFNLEVDNGGWILLAQDVLNSGDDSDSSLDFAVEIQQDTVDLIPNVYPLRVRFDGDTDYNSAIQAGTLALNPEEVSISQPNAIVPYSDSVAIQITALDNDAEKLLNQAAAPKIVYLEVYNGADWLPIDQDTLSSGDNTDDTLDYTISVGPAGVDLPAGSYDLRARFDGGMYYSPAENTGTLTVTAKPVQYIDDIDPPTDDWNWSVVYSDPNIIRFRLIDSDSLNLLSQAGNPKVVYADVNDSFEWVTVAADGLNSIDDSDDTLELDCEIQEGMGDVAPGVFALRLRFNGDGRYVPSVRQGTLTVLKEDTQFIDPDGDWQWTFADSNEMVINIKLLDNDTERLYHVNEEPKTVYADYDDGQGWVNLASAQIQSGGTDVSTGENALIEFAWPYGLGTFDIRFRFEGDTYYNSVISQTATLTVVPPPVVLRVPSEYPTIQQAIDAAGDGDIVLVADGIYTGAGNKDLTWDGGTKHITVISENGPASCTIDCEDIGRAFDFNDPNHDSTDVIDGFTIKSGNADYGGGIYCSGGSVTIINCRIVENTAASGGGMASVSCAPTLINCAFTGNMALGAGGGIYCADYSNLTAINCIITGNSAQGAGRAGSWEFDENFGPIAYDSANDNDGAISGATWTPGYIGSALYFHGGGQWASGSDSVTIPHSPSLDINGPFTLAAWIKATGSDNYLVVIDKYYGTASVAKGVSLYVSSGKLRLSIYSDTDGSRNLAGTSELRDNTWHHVAAVWDGSDAKIYVDAFEEGQVGWSYPPTSTTAPLGIGKRLGGWGGYLPFLGTIDEVAVYDRPLDPNEIEALFNGNAGNGGGGIYGSDSDLTITNCTVTGNSVDGLYSSDADFTVTNSILWGNTVQEVYVNSGAEPVITYSNVQGLFPGDGNISADPCFVDPGYWDPNGTAGDVSDDFWVDGDYHLLPPSLCIDAGDNDSVPADTGDLDDDGSTIEQLPWDIDGHRRFVDDPGAADTGRGTRPIVDIGADEFPYLGDLDFSGFVNLIDFAALGPYWQEGNCDDCGGADLTGDGRVDLDDLMVLCANWLAGIE